MKTILVVDDDPQAQQSTRKILELAGFSVRVASDGQEALELARPGAACELDLILTDVRMPRMGGLEFLRALSVCGDGIPVILMTAFGRVEDAVWAMKFGAVDFLTKPFKRQALLSAVEAALKRSRPRARGDVGGVSEGADETLLGRSQAMRELRAMIARVAPTAASVLITGESGTGKELVARCIHRQSQRGAERFVALNCAAVPDSLIESELFGFEKGAFTGATGARDGLFEAAHQGTLLLDEIGEMPLNTQPKLLRALQEGEVRRLGSNVSKKVDVRLVAATNRDLRECARAGTFRQDLLYRLEVICLRVPPLRERMEDLPDLAYRFLKVNSARHAKSVTGIGEEALELLLAHPWPGNVRELANVIERAVVFARGEHLEAADLPEHLRSASGAVSAGAAISVPLGMSLKEVEDLLIRKTLEATDGDKNMTAKILGINSRTIYRKLDKRAEREPEA
ncbi:MAG: sigma-54 dependent transcriptional regulator [Oligoflexia bacterium]|nr:sigma-54 dependent transcriptional regulator [Oligoflexia bacterium]